MIKGKKTRKEKMEDGKSIWSFHYWRKKYNTLFSEHEVLKEVMASDVYDQVIKQLCTPFETVRYKRENERLREILSVIREERNELIKENKELKKKLEAKLDGGKDSI